MPVPDPIPDRSTDVADAAPQKKVPGTVSASAAEPANAPRHDPPVLRPWLALALLVPAPTIGVLVPLVAQAGPLGQAVYAAAKAWLIGFPFAWHVWVDRRRPSWSPPRRGGFAVGTVSGLAIGVVIVAAYELVGRAWIDAEAAREIAATNGLDQLWKYLALAAYITVVNALVEEYVWRWFVYSRFRARVGEAAAVALAALAFGVHHFVALVVQFGVGVALLGTLGVCVGGAWWSWMYGRYRSVWPPYLSHAIVDVAVFWAGYRILFG